MNLSTATPAEIDAKIAEYETVISQELARRANYVRFIEDHSDQKPYLHQVENYTASVRRIDEHVATERSLLEPYLAEFERRGGWTRAFLAVTNSKGHVHRSTGCSTCYISTQFAWLIEQSGKDETEIVELAGERACTVCYPSAPVEVLARPTQLFSEEEIQAQRDREERAAAKAERERKRIEKALVEPIRVGGDKIETLASAKQRLTDYRLYVQLGWNRATEYEADSKTIAEAIARKTGEAVTDIIAAADKRAAKRR